MYMDTWESEGVLNAKVKDAAVGAGHTVGVPSYVDNHGGRLGGLMLTALGVVFGDIGTSPLYAIRECFHGEYGIAVEPQNILGVLSLMFWALLLIVTLKYLIFVLRADNQGEGGVMALSAMVEGGAGRQRRSRRALVVVGLFAGCLLYGDGMITPAISVLSAVEGIRIITPFFTPYVVPLTACILVGLFLIQRHGTARVGRVFGPIILVWFCVLALLGAVQVARCPQVLAALLPWYGVKFLLVNKMHGFIVLGAVFLVVTGAEALYADMGHFGRRPIQLAWFFLVFPALVLNYFGQGALLMAHPGAAHHPFYAMVPGWAMVPMVVLSTMATIIASQALITGAFSLTRQAIQLGYLPRMKVVHTSAGHIGQIYLAPVNWLLMICTLGLVIGFQTSSKLAAAYGVAVTSTMLITTTLFYMVARDCWGWKRFWATAVTGLFFVVDLPFFFANISKVFHGAWFPLVIGAVFFMVMLTWKQGRRLLASKMSELTPTFERFRKEIEADPPQRVHGRAVYLAGNPGRVPASLVQNLKHNRILHEEVAFLHISIKDVPRVPNLQKIETEKLGGGIYRITAHYGFMEEPRIAKIMALLPGDVRRFCQEDVSFVLGRERLSLGSYSSMRRWRVRLFRFMSRNATDAAAFFDLPPERVIEIGVQLSL